MSTRSVIATELPGGDIRGTYVHWDGYPEHMAVQIDKLIAEHGAEAALTALLAPINGWSGIDTRAGEREDRSGQREVPGVGYAYHDDDGDGHWSRMSWKDVSQDHDYIYIINPADETPLKAYTWVDSYAYDGRASLRRVVPGKNGWDTPVLANEWREPVSLAELAEDLGRVTIYPSTSTTSVLAWAAREAEIGGGKAMRDTLADRCGEEAADRLIAARLHSNRVARAQEDDGDHVWWLSGQERAILGLAVDQHQHGHGIGL